ncbi:hypothetical protein JCM19000A_13630 [Silvimonas sp. JCM 19000]
MPYSKSHRTLFKLHLAAVTGLVAALIPTHSPDFFRIILPPLCLILLLIADGTRLFLKRLFNHTAAQFWQIAARISLCLGLWWIFWLLLRALYQTAIAHTLELKLANTLYVSIWASYGLTCAAATLLGLSYAPGARAAWQRLQPWRKR